jgi:hypothetical protein
MLSTRHFCPSVTKFEFPRHACIYKPNIKFQGNPVKFSNGIGWGRVIKQRQRRDWSSPPLCLGKYGWLPFSHSSSKQINTHASPLHHTQQARPPAPVTPPRPKTTHWATTGSFRDRRTHPQTQPKTLKSHERNNTIPHSEKCSEDVTICRWANCHRRCEAFAIEDETNTKFRDVYNQ